jgi:hypothetical protein
MTTTANTNNAITTTSLLRWSGLAAIAAGVIFAAIQPIHPPDVLASVTTAAWSILMPLKLAMCLLFLVGITGIYARQAGRAGWLGFAGFAILILSWFLQTGYVFAEGFILPVIASTAPQFVDSLLGIVSGAPATMDLGALPAVYGVVGICYMLGGLIFGIATVRAGVLPRLPAIVLAVAATLTPLAALLPHAIQRYAAIPVALAIAWLGFTLWSELRSRTVRNAVGDAVTAAE